MASFSEIDVPPRQARLEYRARLNTEQSRATWAQMAVASNLPVGVRAAIADLADGKSAARSDLLDLCQSQDGIIGTPVLDTVLEHLALLGKIDIIETTREGAPRLTVRAATAALLQPGRTKSAFDADTLVHFSRYVSIRPEGAGWLIEGPFKACSLVLHDVADLALIAPLGRSSSFGKLCDGVRTADSKLLLPALSEACLIIDVRAKEGGEGDMVPWEHHDLMSHSRSRMGRHELPFGGTYRGKGTVPMPKVTDAPPPAASYDIALDRPDIDKVRQAAPPFVDVVETRRSRRHFGKYALTHEALGEFLYRASSIRRMTTDDSGWEMAWKPYPAGGAIHELEIYPLINTCGDVPPGLYHYDALEHRLGLVNAADVSTDYILKSTYHMMGKSEVPHVMILIAARFDRVFWKYESMAYSLVLKNVGVLLQTMYLVAEAMGLAACALGGGNSDLFAQISGRSYLREGLVGELALGSRREEPPE